VVEATDTWDPGQYNRFADERERPFWDLADLLDGAPQPRVVDLGCGDGRLTSSLARRLGARSMLGIDNSGSMIDAAGSHADPTTQFRLGDIARFTSETPLDIVFSNAALHWIPDHESVLTSWRSCLAAGGQLAIQVPCNADHVAHQMAAEIAAEYIDDAPPDAAAANVLAPDRYAEILDELGFVDQAVRLAVYTHHLASSSDVVQWIKGSTLTRFKGPMSPETFEVYVAEVQRRVVERLGAVSPYLYTFKRILMWGKLS
jgi:trans-aconitate 2-methyltransferase